MAQYKINRLINDHVTLEMLLDQPFGNDISDQGEEGVYIRSRRSLEAAERFAERHTPATTEAVAAEMDQQTEPRATAKQVAFILKLISQDRHEGCHMNIPTDYDAIARAPRSLASMYIDAMLAN